MLSLSFDVVCQQFDDFTKPARMEISYCRTDATGKRKCSQVNRTLKRARTTVSLWLPRSGGRHQIIVRVPEFKYTAPPVNLSF